MGNTEHRLHRMQSGVNGDHPHSDERTGTRDMSQHEARDKARDEGGTKKT